MSKASEAARRHAEQIDNITMSQWQSQHPQERLGSVTGAMRASFLAGARWMLEEARPQVDTSTLKGPSGGMIQSASALFCYLESLLEENEK
jgi:hypothetical protein